ncbi:MAG: hypothetical protein EX271_06045 [Acidimicrobiales bacterium]|nr:hypothetical protein [Hyphomonadaceae bacterium]RZV42372.1 MAG: hypothetical protein EX271_06045 [Acidimicrobiales bacterium]
MKRAIIAALVAGTALIGTSSWALTAEQTVEREIIVKNEDGSETVKREEADTVVPGESIVYSINYYNDLDKPAENVVLVMPVPTELTFSEGSADFDGVQTTFSTDGGKTFALRESVVVKRDDNSTRAADAADITHVKWVVASITPDQRGSLSFKGKLN